MSTTPRSPRHARSSAVASACRCVGFRLGSESSCSPADSSGCSTRRAARAVTPFENRPRGRDPRGSRIDRRRSTGRPRRTPGSFSAPPERSEEHAFELQSRGHLVCRLLLEKKKNPIKLISFQKKKKKKTKNIDNSTK